MTTHDALKRTGALLLMMFFFLPCYVLTAGIIKTKTSIATILNSTNIEILDFKIVFFILEVAWQHGIKNNNNNKKSIKQNQIFVEICVTYMENPLSSNHSKTIYNMCASMSVSAKQ